MTPTTIQNATVASNVNEAIIHPRDPAASPRDYFSAGGPSSRASVSSATSASSWTSADDETSSSEPSRARAARPALLSISSAILVSMVCAAMIRHAVTGSLLADPVDPVDRLGLLGVGPRELGEHDVGGDLEVDADAGGGQRADDDGDVGVVDEGVDVLLAAPSGSGRRGSRSSGARAWRRSPRRRPSRRCAWRRRRPCRRCGPAGRRSRRRARPWPGRSGASCRRRSRRTSWWSVSSRSQVGDPADQLVVDALDDRRRTVRVSRALS